MPAVTVYISRGDTPTNDGNSFAGHMWFELHSDEGQTTSYGFAPIEHGKIRGPGYVNHTDTINYKYHDYERTLKISQSQYDAMETFGKDPFNNGFDYTYNGFTNSCVDFTWKALEKGGLNPTGYEGNLAPTENIGDVKYLIQGEDVENPNKEAADKNRNLTKMYPIFNDPQTSNTQSLGAGKQSKLMAVSVVPSFNYVNSKRTKVRGFTLVHTLDNAEGTAKKTTFNGQPAYLLAKTEQPTCMGDEPGWAGGVKSGTVGRKVKPTSGSSSIIVEGKQLVREGDTCMMNNGNVVGKYVSVTPNV